MSPRLRAGLVLVLLALCACRATEPPTPAAAPSRPNILVIVADDLGYTDLGAFGSEIATPNLDALVGSGLLFTQFYAAPMCSPSRAMLLSGMDNHRAGLGNLFEKLADNQKGRPGYEGHLPERVAALPELLRAAGYGTYMTGKWHLGEDEAHGPAARGFDRSFALVESGAGHFADMQPLSAPGPALYRDDGRLVNELPADFYSSRFFADRLVEYLDGHERNRPFFAYLAFTAPHFPLQAPDETLQKYRGRYDEGYDVLHTRRVERLKALGLVPEDAESFPRLPQERPWSALSEEEKRISARRMEIHAAMVDELDRAVGRVVAWLKDNGLYENTVIFFMSDNGAEGHWLHQGLGPLEEWSQQFDNSYENMGRPGSYVMLGPNWARAITGPYRLFKGFTSEGGVRVPAFLHFPARLTGGRAVHQALSVVDVMPTLLDLAGVDHPAPRFGGRDVLPMQGHSLVGLLDPEAAPRAFDMGWEFLGKRAFREGDWKVIWQPAQPAWEPWPGGIRTETWQLYNLARDPAELHDLSAEHPDVRDRLVQLWEAYARENGVILPDRVSGY